MNFQRQIAQRVAVLLPVNDMRQLCPCRLPVIWIVAPTYGCVDVRTVTLSSPSFAQTAVIAVAAAVRTEPLPWEYAGSSFKKHSAATPKIMLQDLFERIMINPLAFLFTSARRLGAKSFPDWDLFVS
jgi:hypothetical protein